MSTFADMHGAARAPPGPQLPAGEDALLSSDAAAAKAPSAASSERQADKDLATPLAVGANFIASTGGPERACKSSTASGAGDAVEDDFVIVDMEDDFVLVDMSAISSMKQEEERAQPNMAENGMQVSTTLSSAQPDSLHAEPLPAEVALQATIEAAPMELAAAAEHLPDSAAEQAQQHSRHQAQLYILHGQHHLSSRPQHSFQPRVSHEAPPQSASGVSRQQPGRDVKPRCMVHVSLSTIGAGVATEGAAVVGLSAEEASDIRRSLSRYKQVSLPAHPHDRRHMSDACSGHSARCNVCQPYHMLRQS